MCKSKQDILCVVEKLLQKLFNVQPQPRGFKKGNVTQYSKADYVTAMHID